MAAVLHESMSIGAAARRFGLPRSTLSQWQKRFRERGHLRPDRQGGGTPSRIEPERERILRILEARPDLSMYGLRDALAAEGLAFHATTVRNFLKRHGLERDRLLARHERRKRRRRRAGR